MTDRQALKMRLIHQRGWKCDWCGRTTPRLEMHEAFLKRSDVPKKKQDQIFTEWNCVLLCPECHAQHGQERWLRAFLLNLQERRGYDVCAEIARLDLRVRWL
jgi:hypothetical protein